MNSGTRKFFDWINEEGKKPNLESSEYYFTGRGIGFATKTAVAVVPRFCHHFLLCLNPHLLFLCFNFWLALQLDCSLFPNMSARISILTLGIWPDRHSCH